MRNFLSLSIIFFWLVSTSVTNTFSSQYFAKVVAEFDARQEVRKAQEAKEVLARGKDTTPTIFVQKESRFGDMAKYIGILFIRLGIAKYIGFLFICIAAVALTYKSFFHQR